MKVEVNNLSGKNGYRIYDLDPEDILKPNPTYTKIRRILQKEVDELIKYYGELRLKNRRERKTRKNETKRI